MNNIKTNWLKYLAAFVIIAVPLFPKFPFIRVSGTFVSVRLEDLFLAASALTVFWYYQKKREFFKDNLNLAIVFFLLAGLISLVSSVIVTQTVDLKLGVLHLLRRVEYFVPFYIAAAAVMTNRKNMPFFLKILVIVTFFVSVYGFGQKYFDWPVIITQNEEYSTGIALKYVSGGHINSTFAGHYDLGTFLVLILPIFVSLFFTVRERSIKFILLFVSLFGMWLLASTASRISLAAIVISTSSSLLLIRKAKFIPIVIFVIILFAGTSANLLSRYGRIIEVAKKQILSMDFQNTLTKPVLASQGSGILPQRRVSSPTPTSVPVLEDRSSNIRLNVEWPRAIRAFQKNPLVGTGYSSITLATDNDYLRALGETGALGLVVFGVLFIKLISEIFYKTPLTEHFEGWELGLIAGFAGSMPGIFLNALFIDVFEASKFAIMFWFIAGLSVTIVRLKNSEPK